MAKQPKHWPHKVRPVLIKEMRVPPVGIVQRRYNPAQAEEYAANLDLNKIGIPAVNHRGGIYWIVDGQHRVEALKIFFAPSDPGGIECSVYNDLSDSEMAELFIGLNTRRTVNRFDLFQIACSAERIRESEVRRVVESNRLKISQSKEPHSVSAVSALCRIYDRCGSTVLGQTLRVVRDGLSGDLLAFDGQLLRGVANVIERFNGRTRESRFVTALGEVKGASAILRRAESQRERTGNDKAQCISAALVDIYNKGLPHKDRLPSWWREAGRS